MNLLFILDGLLAARQELDPTATVATVGVGLGIAFKTDPDIKQHLEIIDGKTFVGGYEVTWTAYDPYAIAMAEKKYVGQK